MNNRCYSPKNKYYDDYGGRGIRVCKEWRIGADGIKNFIAWNNSLPKNEQWRKGLQIERINNNRSYKPSNCRWATPLEQGSNKRDSSLLYKISYKNREYTLKDFYKKYGVEEVSISVAYRRIKNGMHPFKACTQLSQRHKDYKKLHR